MRILWHPYVVCYWGSSPCLAVATVNMLLISKAFRGLSSQCWPLIKPVSTHAWIILVFYPNTDKTVMISCHYSMNYESECLLCLKTQSFLTWRLAGYRFKTSWCCRISCAHFPTAMGHRAPGEPSQPPCCSAGLCLGTLIHIPARCFARAPFKKASPVLLKERQSNEELLGDPIGLHPTLPSRRPHGEGERGKKEPPL